MPTASATTRVLRRTLCRHAWVFALSTLLQLLEGGHGAVTPRTDCCSCTEGSPSDIAGAGECLAVCGYVIMRQAFDRNYLSNYLEQWEPWFNGEEDLEDLEDIGDDTERPGRKDPLFPRSHYLASAF